MQANQAIVGLVLIALLATGGCGGSSPSGGGSGGMNEITWPDRDGGTTSQLPPSIETGRVVFASESGDRETCCVAVDPALLSGSAQRGLAILTDLPVGPAIVTVAGFSTDFAPAVSGIDDTCKTVPAEAAQPCDTMRVAAPAFESPPLAVTIIAGAQTDIGEVPMEAFPFLLDFSPAQDTSAAAPVQFALKVVDAATNIRQDSVALEVSFTAPDESAEDEGTGSPFRILTKRVALNLTACADGTTAPCSPGGNLQLAGFAATGTAPELPEGSVEAHITAANLGDPPRDLDFRYSFMVLATPTATATATPTAEAAAALEGAAPAVPVVAGQGAQREPGVDAEASAKPATGPFRAIPPTPTATPLPGGDK